MTKKIVVKGAKMHNLKNINVEIPRDKLTVVTGVSGSGKSTLAFDTIYAEGQRRYMESLSTYSRQFLQSQEKPEVDSIEGLSPAISIDQKTAPRNPRSTVGTVTEIYDYLRLLFAKVGVPKNPKTGRIMQKQTPAQIVTAIDKWEDGERYLILSPVVKGRKGVHEDVFNRIKKAGFVRVRIDGYIKTINEDFDLDENQEHTIEIVVDRLKKEPYARIFKELSDGTKIEQKNDNRMRLLDSIETALQYGEGILIAHRIKDESDHLFSELLSDPETGYSFPPIEPRIFSFNSPHGACQACHGLGYRLELNREISLNPKLSIREGGILPWASLGTNSQEWYFSVLEAIGKKYKFTLDDPISKIDKDVLNKLFDGFGDEYFEVALKGAFQGKQTTTEFEGIIAQNEKRYNESDSEFVRKKLEEFMIESTCTECGGARLNEYARNVFLTEDKNIFDVVKMSIPDLKEWAKSLELKDETRDVIIPIQKEIIDRANFLENVGLSYLTLSRTANTLSGGEAQRIRLATQIGSQLEGVLYVLDEPSIGLHQKDNDRLIGTMEHLRDIGNTVIVVEHDEDTMRIADYLVEIGPKAGVHGGELVFSGTFDEMKNVKTETSDFLFGRKKIRVPRVRRKPLGELIIKGARENNLLNIDVTIPFGCFVGVSGVSGSGKSSLINKILVPTLARELNRAKKPSGLHDDILGIDQLDKLISISQSPIGRTPRSNPATYTKVFTDIREVFAATPEAKIRGYNIRRFSFNAKGGRCEACGGDGIKKIEMHFLPDVFVPCEECAGKRYNSETLEITYRGKSISDVLNMTIEDALAFFDSFANITQKLQALVDVGLGYISLGQSATTLSGGEAQRVKLASELMKTSTGKTIYVLDEPTTGLHFSDVKKLLSVLQQLVDKGNSIIVIEHNLDVIKCCDHVIDIGPEGGSGGGLIVASGTPEEICKVKNSHTGYFLDKILKNKK